MEFFSDIFYMHLVNLCPADLERHLLMVDEKHRSMAIGYIGLE
jgi:hypothetical protein